MKKFVVMVLALVVFVGTAYAAVSLENVQNMVDLREALGTPTSVGNDGTNYLSYNGAPRAFIVSKWVRVNTPAYPDAEVPVGTEVAQGTPCTIRLNAENILADTSAVDASTFSRKDDWRSVATDGELFDLEGTNRFNIISVKKIRVGGNWGVNKYGTSEGEIGTGEIVGPGWLQITPPVSSNAGGGGGCNSGFGLLGLLAPLAIAKKRK